MRLSDAVFGCPPMTPRSMPRDSGCWPASTRCWARWSNCRPRAGFVLTGRLSAGSQGWLSDHAVGGVVIFPGAGFVEMAIRAGDEVGCSVVDELTLAAPLVIPATGSVAVQVVVDGADESGHRAVSVLSRADAHSGWTLHAEGIVRPGAVEPGTDLGAWPPPGATPVDIDGLYERLAARGYGYGPAFQGLTADVAPRRRDLRRRVTARRRRGVAGRIRGAPGGSRRHAARDDHRHRGRPGRQRRCPGAVLVAGRVAARGGRIVGAGAHRAFRPVVGVGGTV